MEHGSWNGLALVALAMTIDYTTVELNCTKNNKTFYKQNAPDAL